jgi:hypothetical protein
MQASPFGCFQRPTTQDLDFGYLLNHGTSDIETFPPTEGAKKRKRREEQ